jgi:amino acid adenylation domain-containing protein
MEKRQRAKTVLEYLEYSAEHYPEKEAYEDKDTVLTFAQVKQRAEKIGTTIAESLAQSREPVAVFMDKNVQSIVSFFGVLYSGNFYCPLDTKMPVERIQIILGVLKPRIIVTDAAHKEQAESFAGDSQILLWEEMMEQERNEDLLLDIRASMTELDPLYVLFTSGSTGVPKGVLLNHRVVTNYMEWLEEKFEIDSTSVFGNQAPFYFDVSIHDIYGTLYFGAKMVIIPQSYFSFPVKLIEYMNEKKVSTFLWVPSAMSIVANLQTFSVAKPEYLKQIMFAGEVLPWKQLEYWVENIPDAVYANLYGPTETFVCTGYIRNGSEPEGQPLPIGVPVSNSQALILDEQGHEVPKGEIGELCMRGSCLALGYYANSEKTSQAFVQNPLHDRYPDRIYHTGDLVRYDEHGNLIYVSRKDFQIKHMGYRIELGEIETAGNAIEAVRDCACLYNHKRKKIVFFYDGTEMDKKELLDSLARRVPQYMVPGKVKYLKSMPHNANGKIDRAKLKELL